MFNMMKFITVFHAARSAKLYASRDGLARQLCIPSGQASRSAVSTAASASSTSSRCCDSRCSPGSCQLPVVAYLACSCARSAIPSFGTAGRWFSSHVQPGGMLCTAPSWHLQQSTCTACESTMTVARTYNRLHHSMTINSLSHVMENSLSASSCVSVTWASCFSASSSSCQQSRGSSSRSLVNAGSPHTAFTHAATSAALC